MLDHRLVQTAVIGHRNSDHPVILPMDAWELDRWRKAHPGYSYWCGLQLGGCGGELSDRRYTTKVCHFAHHPTAPVCHRKNNGESSADHLFIKRGVQRLLGRGKVKGRVETRDLGSGPGDAVDVYLPDSRRRLRFQLNAVDYRAWRRADDELAADADGIDWFFSSEGPITQQLVGRHGYCLRVRCETVGGERRVHIGAEARDRTVSWTPLEDCAVTPSGIVTPDTEKIRLTRPRPRPAVFPLQGGLAFALVPEADVPADSPFAAKDRHLLVADVKPVDGPIVRALVSLPGDTEVPPAEHVYRVPDGARLLIAEGASDWTVEARRYTRLNAHEAQRTGLWTRPTVAEPVVAQTVPEPRTREPEPVNAAKPLTIHEPPAAPALLSRGDMATAVRDALIQHARLRTTTTWETLARTVSPALAQYSDTGRRDLLVAVDSPLRENVPVLSALIRDQGMQLPYLFRVLSELGVPHAAVSHRIKRWAAVETERAFAAYGVPARSIPPRMSLEPEHLPVTHLADARKPADGFAAHQRTVDHRQVTAQRGDGEMRSSAVSKVRRLRALVTELEQMLPTLGKGPRKRARKALRPAQIWLDAYDGTTRTTRRKRAALVHETAGDFVLPVQRALEAAKESVRAAKQNEERQRAREERPRRAADLGSRANRTTQGPHTAAEDPVGRLTRQLVDVAAVGRTVPLQDLVLGSGGNGARHVLSAVDRETGPDVPLLSALVTGKEGMPVAFFRDILRTVGLAVPQTDEALLKIWRREQERAYAAHGNPPRPLPPRLVPTASQAGPPRA
ncbi:hypothetical protein ACIGO6_26620 [Streptomyces sp. NPDC053750]|uniref:hypothetical protein n=1 Tax=Streptomyces sp. NPDC053750 TaxID=3365714 RepID=UPI0037CFC41E